MEDTGEDIRTLVFEHIRSKGIMQKWLAEKAGISTSHLWQILNLKRDLTLENLKKINEALGTEFTNPPKL